MLNECTQVVKYAIMLRYNTVFFNQFIKPRNNSTWKIVTIKIDVVFDYE